MNGSSVMAYENACTIVFSRLVKPAGTSAFIFPGHKPNSHLPARPEPAPTWDATSDTPRSRIPADSNAKAESGLPSTIGTSLIPQTGQKPKLIHRTYDSRAVATAITADGNRFEYRLGPSYGAGDACYPLNPAGTTTCGKLDTDSPRKVSELPARVRHALSLGDSDLASSRKKLISSRQPDHAFRRKVIATTALALGLAALLVGYHMTEAVTYWLGFLSLTRRAR